MAPQLIARQLEAGAWGVTAANISQVQLFRSFGIPRILIANEVTDRAGLAWLAAELAADPEFECYSFVDSLSGVALLDDALRAGYKVWRPLGKLRAPVAGPRRARPHWGPSRLPQRRRRGHRRKGRSHCARAPAGGRRRL